MSVLHPNILDENRANLFQRLGVFKTTGYLAGGTSLALQIGHRVSVDFDIFVEHEIGNTLRKRIQETIEVDRYNINTGDQITLQTPDGISVTFLWYYYPRITPLVETDSLPLASLPDIAADKVITIGRRAVWRDYVDMFFLLRDHFSLQDIIGFAREKFGKEFIDTQFLEQLTYFEDMSVVKIDYIDRTYNDTEIKLGLSNYVKEYIDVQ